YPEGINQLVIPLDISSGERIGALVLEYTPLYKDILVGVKQEATRNMIFYTAILGLGLVAGYAYVGKLVPPLREMRKA
ncbi:MAG: hypothetical protein GWO41_13205, partial [candidate division Zixibacteria bacterium]|nr:hypothetical protein [candidate division Zixibacteria bacterium]NIR66897.1 hypothetical protein [candidate division Zixibacteria bacterium]NIS45018.1 hypothetical protein [candidate division Zixibacteria bacterium]NIT53657.1 hypothetical protein [candidate division Zixibacteria bacterium]NIU13115.1 hypothetical protein [candidate division Zixibacteria bacterium]